MQHDPEHLELVRQAAAGDRESLSSLANLAQVRVGAYVRRVILNEDGAQDITQEAMVAMLSSLRQLRDPHRFWPWIFTIASNKVRQSFRRADLHPVGLSDIENTHLEPRSEELEPAEGLSRLELVELTRNAMKDLDVRYRMVLAMRFYEDMPHAAISHVLGCSEMTARVTFLRAKRALVRALRRRGVREATLMAALLAFGRQTAPAQAAARVTVSPQAFAETFLRQLVGWKSGIGAAACLALLIAWTLPPFRTGTPTRLPATVTAEVHPDPSILTSRDAVWIRFQSRGVYLGSQDERRGEFETWICYPAGWNGPHLIAHLSVSAKEENQPRLRPGHIVSAHASFDLDSKTKQARLTNKKTLFCGKHTAALPTDPVDFCQFIAEQEDEGTHAFVDKLGFTFDRDSVTGFVTAGIQKRDAKQMPLRFEIVRANPGIDLLNYAPPAGYEVVDLRDPMRQREWTQFTVKGRLGSHLVSGGGRVPFTYAASFTHPASLHLTVDGDWEIFDDLRTARVVNARQNQLAIYPGGSFWQGLGRPWEGFHTGDSIRRDAARARLSFVLHAVLDSQKAVTVGPQNGREQSPASPIFGEYLFDADEDLLQSIRLTSNADGVQLAELAFSYATEVRPDVPSGGPFQDSAARVTASAPNFFWPAEVLHVIDNKDTRQARN